MNKRNKKLALAPQTIRALDLVDLKKVAGGVSQTCKYAISVGLCD